MRREYHAHRLWQMDGIDQMSGPQTLPTELARFQRVDTPERLGASHRAPGRLSRRTWPRWQTTSRPGRLAGRTAARPVVERTITQTRRVVETPIEEFALLAAHPEIAGDERAALAAAIERSVQPPLREFLALLEAYLPYTPPGRGDLLAAGR